MLSFSLDTNCLIDVDEARPEAGAVLALADAHQRGDANVAVVAISASEKQKDEQPLTNFEQFKSRLSILRLGHLDILRPMFYWNITFWDWAYWTNEEMVDLERGIHEILIPNIEFLWPDFCKARGWDPKTHVTDAKWRNAKCDVQALWSHIHHHRDIFVTSDSKFHAVTKSSKLLALGAGRILTPQDALTLLNHTVHAV